LLLAGTARERDGGQCLGPPSCPIGRAAAGVECVALAAAATPSEPAAIREPDGALLGAGIALIVVGYLGAVITDTVAGTSTANIPSPPCIGYCRGPAAPNWGFGFLPLLHPAAGIDAYEPFRTIVFVVSSIGTALEITGLVLAILGQIGRVRTPSSLAAGEARLRWSAPGTQGGMSFELAF